MQLFMDNQKQGGGETEPRLLGPLYLVLIDFREDFFHIYQGLIARLKLSLVLLLYDYVTVKNSQVLLKVIYRLHTSKCVAVLNVYLYLLDQYCFK